MTSGVPSASAAQVRAGRAAEGCASTWLRTVTSAGTASPAKGEPAGNGARCSGRLQDIAPPSARLPASSGTGSSGSAPAGGAAAVRGPAKRISSPPRRTQAASAVRSGPKGSGSSASTIAAIRSPSSVPSPAWRSAA